MSFEQLYERYVDALNKREAVFISRGWDNVHFRVWNMVVTLYEIELVVRLAE